MSPYLREQKVAAVRRFMEEFQNKENLDIVFELMTPDFALHLPGAQLPPGAESQKFNGVPATGKKVFWTENHS